MKPPLPRFLGARREQQDGLRYGVVEVADTACRRVQCTQHASKRNGDDASVFPWLAAAHTPRLSRMS